MDDCYFSLALVTSNYSDYLLHTVEATSVSGCIDV